jgi:hypothetical protein
MTTTNDEKENRKKAIFESMSTRRQKHILKIGYEKWDPFQEPKDPIDIRKDKTKRTSQMLIREFLQNTHGENYTNDYGRGAFEICLGIINEEEKYKGMYDFVKWYTELKKREGLEDED